jgi:hypothetical protein
VAHIEYRVGAGGWEKYTGAFEVTGDGTHLVEYRSMDVAGNLENVEPIEIKIDATPPVSEVEPIEPYWRNAGLVPFKITATTEGPTFGSELELVELHYRHSSDNRSWGPWIPYGVDANGSDGWSWVFDIENRGENDGYYEFRSVAVDVAGNIEAVAPRPKVVFEESFNGFTDGALAGQAGWVDVSLRGWGGLSVSPELPYEGAKGVVSSTHWYTQYQVQRTIPKVQSGGVTIHMRVSAGVYGSFQLLEDGAVRAHIVLDGRDHLMRFGALSTPAPTYGMKSGLSGPHPPTP